MNTTLLALTLTALSLIYWPAAADAQEARTARGTVSKIGGNFVTVQVAGAPMTFTADKNTEVEARGAGTKSRQVVASGKAGPQLGDVLTVGQLVAVTYRDVAGTPYASKIKGIASVGNSGDSAVDMKSTGTVKVIAGDSITILGNAGGGGSFTQTFVVSPATKVIGRGAGTAARANGGRVAFTDLIKPGDTVSIAYHKAGDRLQASDVHILLKNTGSN